MQEFLVKIFSFSILSNCLSFNRCNYLQNTVLFLQLSKCECIFATCFAESGTEEKLDTVQLDTVQLINYSTVNKLRV